MSDLRDDGGIILFGDEPPLPEKPKNRARRRKSRIRTLDPPEDRKKEEKPSVPNTAPTPERRAALEAELEKHISPPGALKLAELRGERLERERLEKRLPDELFKVQPFHDRILVYRFAENQSDTFIEGGKIVMTEMTKQRKRDEVPRGILVGAGLGAMDSLHSNGIEIGDTILIIKNAPWRIVSVTIDGAEFSLLVLRDGDVIGSETLQERLASGEVKIKQHRDEDGGVQHIFVDKDGNDWIPRPSWVSDDFT